MQDLTWWSFFGFWISSIVQVMTVLFALVCAILFARCAMTQTELELKIAKFEERVTDLPRNSRIADAFILGDRSRVQRLRRYQYLLGIGVATSLTLFILIFIATKNPALV